MPTLDLGVLFRVYADATPTTSPQRRHVDLNLNAFGIDARKPREIPLDLAAGEVSTVFDGSRSLGLNGATELALSLSSLAPDRYRLTWTGTGATPAFRAERAFGANGNSLTLTLNANLTLTVTGSGPTYTAAQIGDQVLIPGVATGDTGPFDARNVGYWDVLGATSSSLTLGRPAGDTTTGATETVAVSTALQFQVFSPGPTLAGDTLDLSAGFSSNARRSYVILSVAPRYVDLQSSVALAPETAVPGASGLSVYSASHRALLVVSDQLLGLQLNGDTSETAEVQPLILPSGERLGLLLLTGPVHKLVVTNKAATQMDGYVVAVP